MAKVFILGEFMDEAAARLDRAFAGPTESLLYGLLRQVGIDAKEVYVTNVIQRRPPRNDFKEFCGPKGEALFPKDPPLVPGKYIRKEFAEEFARLDAELARERPNIVLAMGNMALWAISRKTGIKKYRGSPLPSHDNQYKVIPTWALGSIFRQWENRAVVLADFSKVAREKEFPEINRPQHFIHMEPSLEDIEKFYHKYLIGEPFLSADIETKSLTITEFGVSTSCGTHCLVIPFWDRIASDGNYWDTAEEEIEAWGWVRRICENFYLIGQNFSFDMQYLWRTVGIPCPKFLGDTMLQHHSLQPEMEKGLGFLGSIYTNEPSWKFMRQDHGTLKREDN